jgi:ADP-sugar diphosphatase
MLDDSGNFAGAAAKEIQEECGLEVAESELVNISELAASRSNVVKDEENVSVGVFPSVGACDEFIPIFLCQKRVKRSELKQWEGKLTGLREEGEKITLKLVKLEDLWKAGRRDAKALSALALYQGLKTEGAI